MSVTSHVPPQSDRNVQPTSSVARLILFAGWLLAPCTLWAQTSELPEIVGVQVGLAGHYRAGVWTPVKVTLRAGSQPAAGQLILTVPDGDGVPSRVSTPAQQPWTIPAGQSRTIELCVRFGRAKSELGVEFRADAGTTQRVFRAGDSADAGHFPPAVPSHRELVVTIGTEPLGVEEAFDLLHRPARDRAVVVRLEQVADLPTQWLGYEGFDAVVISTSDLRVFAGLEGVGSLLPPNGVPSPQDSRRKKTPDPLAALDQWVRMGGKLVLCAGRNAEDVLGEGRPLAQFAPGRFQKMIDLLQTGALETYAGSSIPVPRSAGGRSELRVPQLAQVEGTIEAREADLPLVVRQARGFGQVVFVAADLDRAPLRQWSERGRLVGKLLDVPQAGAPTVEEGRAVMHFGYTDLAGQLRSALDQFDAVGYVPFWIVLALLVGYILAVGPVDYLLLRRVFGRMVLTWVTFPLIVVAFGAGAYFLAHRVKESRTRVSQIDLVDVDEATGRIRGTAWANLYSPKTDRYNLAFQPRLPGGNVAQDATTLTAWLGLPGSGLGGMDQVTVDSAAWTQRYDFSQRLDGLQGVPVRIWSTRSLTARWTAQSDVRLQVDLIEEDRLPQGTITNSLSFPLADCVLAYGRWAYELGTLKPGQSAHVGPMARRRELETFLTGRKLDSGQPSDKFRLDTTPLYDQGSVDPAQILRAMIFYDAAGGRRWTGLFNRYQGFVDLSGLLKANRAILVGRAAADAAARHHGADLLRDGQPLAAPGDPHVTVYRFVIPVQAAKSG